jgi:hypothetical protein
VSDTTTSLACAAPTVSRRSRGAWQPFTGNGVSRFADASFGRALGFLGGFALSTALVLGWALYTSWWPVLDQAVREFPEDGPALVRGRFHWPETAPRLLADSPHLGVAVRPDDSEPPGRTADLQLELLPGALRLAGIAGFVDLPWPATDTVPLGRLQARAAWEAWRRPVFASVIIAAAAAMTVVWSLLALALVLPLRLVAFVLQKQISLGGCWRLSAAASMSGSLVLNLGIGGYLMRWLPWPALAAVVVIHLLVSALFLSWGLVSRPKKSRIASPPNPFHVDNAQSGSRRSVKNPFG